VVVGLALEGGDGATVVDAEGVGAAAGFAVPLAQPPRAASRRANIGISAGFAPRAVLMAAPFQAR
jgi:hypothetical protein